MEKKSEIFSYIYSAEKQEEIRKIRQKYLPEEEDKMQQLLHLDRAVERKGAFFSIAVGIIGTLVFGVGMCMCLVWNNFALGIVIGILGALLLCCAYPIYCRVVMTQRKKVAPEIIRLSDDLLK